MQFNEAVRILVAGSALSLLMIPAAAQSAPPKKSPPPTASSDGARIFKDPVTGAIKDPDAADLQSLTGGGLLKAKSAATPKPIVSTGGLIGLRLPEDYMDSMVAVKGPDGKLTFRCVEGKAAPAQVIQAPARKAVLDEK
jgi:hypothetical protein